MTNVYDFKLALIWKYLQGAEMVMKSLQKRALI